MKKSLLQKNGWIAMELAREFLRLNPGDRIPTVSDFCEKFDTARGTVQIALKHLGDTNAIRLIPRGVLGTFVDDIDYMKLLEIADIKTIVGVMPLPYTRLYEGFATGIYQSVKESGFPLYLAYMRGAQNRIELLEEHRYSFAITSRLAAETFIAQGRELAIIMDFGSHTYVSEHGIIFHDRKQTSITDGMKVGIDRSSIDQSTLTMKCCEHAKVTYVDVYYNQILEKLDSGEIDAAVWSVDELKDTKWKDRYVIPDNQFAKMNTDTVIVVNRSEDYLGHILQRFIKKEHVIETQRRVLEEKLIPSY